MTNYIPDNCVSLETAVYLPLTNSAEICIINVDDYFSIQKRRLTFCATFNNSGRIEGIKSTKRTYQTWLGEYIIGKIQYRVVDHIDRNPLNNLRLNLRHVTYSLNGQNKIMNNGKLYRGTTKRKYTFEANIVKNRVLYHLGQFETEEQAAKAYDKKAIELYGKNCYLNFPTI